jgi:hypothetical protein
VIFHGTEFKQPSLDYSIQPFWMWNSRLRPEELVRQLHEFRDKQISDIYIHGRYGLITPYLSDEWFDCIEIVCKEAKKIGMRLWIYDEYNWPSGTAGLKVCEDHPELTQRLLQLVETHQIGSRYSFLKTTDARYLDTDGGRIIAAWAVPLESGRKNWSRAINLNQYISFDSMIMAWEVPEGEWAVLHFIEKQTPWYIDALNPKAVDKFIEYTHEHYAKRVGEYFGDVIPGFYTDEPAMHYYQINPENGFIPWTEGMRELFQTENGYDLLSRLASLFYDVDTNSRIVRYDFWNTLTERLSTVFYERVRQWCHDHDLLFTGHLLFEEWFHLATRTEGNVMTHLKHFDIVGVDHIFSPKGSRERPDLHVALKAASSVAHQVGSKRVLCESIGGFGWATTMLDMKTMADWEYVLGVNLFNPHGGHYSIEGDRKRDWPPCQFYQQSWWKYYGQFSEYISRLSYLLSTGRPVADMAILYPVRSYWQNYTSQVRTPLADIIESDLAYLTDALLRLHYGFDYIDEDTISETIVENGAMSIGQNRYSLLILPATSMLKRDTVNKLQEFLDEGGSLLACTMLPEDSDVVASDPKVLDFVRETFNVDLGQASPAAVISQGAGVVGDSKDCANRAILHAGTHPGGGYVGFLQSPGGLSKSHPEELLAQGLDAAVDRRVHIDDQDIFCLHRQADDLDLYFLVNTTANNKTIQVTLSKIGHPELWNPETGETANGVVSALDTSEMTVKLDMWPHQAIFLMVKPGQPELEIESSEFSKPNDVLTPIDLKGEWDFTLSGDNVLLIDSWRLGIDPKGEGLSKGYHLPEFDDTEWVWATNGPWMRVVRSYVGDVPTPTTLWYRTKIDLQHLPNRLQMLIDGFLGKYQLYVNGSLVSSDNLKASSLDCDILAVPLEAYVRQGVNQLAVKIEVDSEWGGIVDKLKVVGDFSVCMADSSPNTESGTATYSLGAPRTKLGVGSWTDSGYPFYSGTGTYSTTFDLPGSWKGKRLMLTADGHDGVVEAWVNGEEAGCRLWAPYVFDVSDLCHDSSNTVTLAVTNTSANTLEGKTLPSGLASARIEVLSGKQV